MEIMWKNRFSLILIFLSIGFHDSASASLNTCQQNYIPGQLIVKFSHCVYPISKENNLSFGLKGVDNLSVQYKAISCHLLFSSTTLSDIYLLIFPIFNDMDRIAQDYSQQKGVIYAEPNYYARVTTLLPDDPLFIQQWALNNTGQTGGTYDVDIDAPEAWSLETGDASIIIAIIDTGIDLNHPDLVGNLVSGWDFVNSNANPQDDNGHGTHLAGIAGAKTNNDQGIAGVCWNCSIMPVKVLDASGTGTYSRISQGIEYAADHGAKVINLSLGSETFSQLLQDAVTYAHTCGCIIVGSAGNFNNSNLFYPAACLNSIAVAGLDHNDVKYQLSSYGSWIDLCAPAVNIMSTVYNDTFATWSGTSMAAAYVSGVAGLLFSAHPNWSNNLVESQLKRLADDVDGLNPLYVSKLGHGRVNAYNVLSTTPLPDLSYVCHSIHDPSPGDNDGVLDQNETTDMTVTVYNSWGDATGVTGILSTSDPFITINDANGSFGTIGAENNVSNSGDKFNLTLSNSCPSGHIISFNLTLQDSLSNTWNLVFTLISGSREYTVPNYISTDTTWLENETYIVPNGLLVDSGATLMIQPGVRVKVSGGITLQDGGKLVAIGSEQNRIVFTSASTSSPGYWGMYLRNAGNNAIYDGDGAYVSGATIQFSNIEYCWSFVISLCNPYIANNDIYNGGAIVAESGSPVIDNNIIYNCSYCGIEIGGGRCVNNKISFIDGGPAILVNSMNAYLLIEKNYIFSNDSGPTNHNNAIIDIDTNNIGTTLIVRKNLIYNNLGHNPTSHFGSYASTIKLRIGYSLNATISDNTIAYNKVENANTENSGSIKFGDIGPDLTVVRNNFFRNHDDELLYEMIAPGANTTNLSCPNNYWMLTNETEIGMLIYDHNDNPYYGAIAFQPFLTSFSETAPPILIDVVIDPPSPVGVEQVQFILFFKSMDTTVQPNVTFGHQTPYDQHAILGDWIDDHHWSGSSNIDHYTGDGENTIKVTSAKDTDGMEIPEDTHYTFIIETGISAVQGLAAVSLNSGIDVTWQPNYESNIGGYYLYYDTDSGVPYNGHGALQGDSPIDVGNVNTFRLTNLIPGQTYHFCIRAYDIDHNLSPYSPEVWVVASPPIPTLQYSGILLLVIFISAFIRRKRIQ